MARKISSVDKVVLAFGRASALAAKLGVAPSTVQAWQRRKVFPAGRNAEILALAEREGIDIAFLSGGEPRISPRLAAGETAVSMPSPEDVREGEAPAAVAPPAAPRKTADVPPVSGKVRAGWRLSAMWGVAVGVFLLAILTASNQFLGIRVRDARLPLLDGHFSDLRRQADAATQAGMESRREMARLAARVADLERRIAVLDGTAGDSSPGLAGTVHSVRAEMAELGGRLDAMKRESQTAEALALALGQVRLVAQGSQPFVADLETARALAAQVAASTGGKNGRLLETLNGFSFYAEKGVPTVADLRDRFDALAGDVAAAVRVPVQGGAAGRFLRWVFSSVRIRRAPSDMAGDGPDAILSRVQNRLRRGDLAAAVSDALRLRAAAPVLLAPWLAAAESRLAVDRLSSILAREALLQLDAGGELPVLPEAEGEKGEAETIAPAPEPVPVEGGAP